MRVTTEHENGRSYGSADIAPDGTYEILANRPGMYRIRVTAPDYVVASRDIAITGADSIITADFQMESGVLQQIEVVTPAGVPIPGVRVLEGVLNDRINPELISSADAAGRYRLRGQPGETRLLYFVPHDGSLAVARFQLPAEGSEAPLRQVVVPPASGSLRVTTVDSAGKPVPAPLLLRYNGEFVPVAILRFVTGGVYGTAPAGEGVLLRLPAGTYEVWAIGNRMDEVPLIASRGTLRRPERVGLSTGEAAVTVELP